MSRSEGVTTLLGVLAVVALLAVAGVAVSGGALAAVDAGATAANGADATDGTVVSAERTVTDTTVAPGGTTTVEVVVDVEGDLGDSEILRVTETFSAGVTGVRLNGSSPVPGGYGTNPNRTEFIAVWNEDAEEYVLRYDVMVPADAEAGDTYEVGGSVAVGDESTSLSTATITVEGGVPEDTGVVLQPNTRTVASNGETTYDVVVTGADEGVGSYALDLALDNASVGEITDVELANRASSGGASVADDGSGATIDADLSEAHSASAGVVIATVTVASKAEGGTTLAIDDDASVGNESGAAYDVSFVNEASLLVSDDAASTTTSGDDGTTGGDGTSDTAATSDDGTTGGDGDSTTGDDGGSGGLPGLGVVPALAALAASSYLLARRRH